MPLSREGVVHRLVVDAFALIDARFVRSPISDNNLDFHNSAHSVGVYDRASAIYPLIFTPSELVPTLERGLDLVRLSAAFHDVDQAWSEREEQDNFGLWRVRDAVLGREQRSFAQLRQLIEWRQLDGAFAPGELDILSEAIIATEAQYDPNLGTVIQPHLNSTTSLVAQAVAMADLSYPGMVGGKEFCRAGDALFRENNLGIKQLIEATKHQESLRPDIVQAIANRIRHWSRRQVLYIRSRRRRFQQEINFLPKHGRECVAQLFTSWDAAEVSSVAASLRRGRLEPADVIRDVGYSLP